MLSKEQLKKQIAEIREYVISEVGLSAGQIKAALENAEALEELLSLREQREAERQRADTLQTERDEFRRRLKLERSILEDTEKQLAELKALPPVAWRYDNLVMCNRIITTSDVIMRSWVAKGCKVTPLFTAAKPAGENNEPM